MKEVVMNYVAAWNNKELSALDKVFTQQSIYWDAMQTGKAIALLTDAITATHEAFPDVSFEIVSLTRSQNLWFLAWNMTGTHEGNFFGAEPTGKIIDVNGLDMIDIQSGSIAEIKSFFDSALFSKQLALG